MTSRLLAACVAAGLLAGCAGVVQNTPLGAPREQVLQKLGTPTASYPLAAGSRLQYSGQPAGREVYNIDLDPAGRVVAVTQAMQSQLLDRFAGRVLPVAELQREIGPPAWRAGVHNFDGDVWTWRWWEIGTPRLFHAYVDRQGMVVRTLSTDEPVRPLFDE